MPTLSNSSDNDEDEYNLVNKYENQESDGEQSNVQKDGGSGSENEENIARRIDPSTSKRHVVRNPLPKLNTERLKGPKGIQTIEKYFEGFKFHGEGYEKLNLDRIMKRLEHWGHRLFPKLDFDDFIDKLEKLGTKKDLQMFITKYRQDMINIENDFAIEDDEHVEEDKDQNEPVDEFDLLISEQIEKQKQVLQSLPNASTNDDAFNKLLSESKSKSSQPVNTTPTSSQLSDEVKERIERNRQQAIQRRLARLQEMQEDAKKQKLEDSGQAQLNTNETQTIGNGEFENNLQKAEQNHEL